MWIGYEKCSEFWGYLDKCGICIIIHVMNDNHSRNEYSYMPRRLAPLIQQAASDHPVTVLTGARQVGKSTLLREEKPFSGWRYLSLDKFDVQNQAEKSPEDLWAGVDQIVLDEVQRSPRLLSAIKQTVDKKHRKVRFVLSGSANLLLMQKVSETLAGRAVYFTLLPMTTGEVSGNPLSESVLSVLQGKWPREAVVKVEREDVIDQMLRGFMPPLLTLSGSTSYTRWWEGYVTSYLERDLRQLSQVDNLIDFRRVMEALALRSGQMLNQTEISRDTKVSQPTIHRYLNLLETSCLLTRLPVFSRNRTKRLIKTPKIYWLDPGLCVYLSGYFDKKSLDRAREVGSFFETLVFLHVRVLSQLMIPQGRWSYWRTVNGDEVDFVMEYGRKPLAFEVKLTKNPGFDDVKGLALFLREYPESLGGILVHAGREIKRLHKKIVAVPWQILV